MSNVLKSALAAMFLLAPAAPALATSGPGCLVVVNVASNDALNVRKRASASSPMWLSASVGTSARSPRVAACRSACPV